VRDRVPCPGIHETSRRARMQRGRLRRRPLRPSAPARGRSISARCCVLRGLRMKSSFVSRIARPFLIGGLVVALGGCAAASSSSPSLATQAAPGAYPADAAAAPSDSPAESAPSAGQAAPPQQPGNQQQPGKKGEGLDLEAADPARALVEAERLIEDVVSRRKTAPHSESGPPTKEGGVADGPCTVCCRALASMRRSADRVCELAPSASPDTLRCDDANDRVIRAERRVRERCPSCAATP